MDDGGKEQRDVLTLKPILPSPVCLCAILLPSSCWLSPHLPFLLTTPSQEQTGSSSCFSLFFKVDFIPHSKIELKFQRFPLHPLPQHV